MSYENSTNRRGVYAGFTLVELLVVVSIISLLASITLAAIDSARQNARLTAAKADLQSLFTEAELYYSSNNSYITTEREMACGTAAGTTGFLSTSNGLEILNHLSSMTGIASTNNSFYCDIDPYAWSLAIDVSSLTGSAQVLCASTNDGRIQVLNNSNDSNVEAFISDNNTCITP